MSQDRRDPAPEVIVYWNRFLARARASRRVEGARGLLRPVGRPRPHCPVRFYWGSWAAARRDWLARQEKPRG